MQPHPPAEARLQHYFSEVIDLVREELFSTSIDDELHRAFDDYAAAVRAYGSRIHPNPGSTSQALFFLSVAAEGRVDRSTPQLGAALTLYGLSLGLFDAVQDDQLVGQFQLLGPNVSTNAALILFLLATQAYEGAIHDQPDACRMKMRALFRDHSLLAGRAQHADLRGCQPESFAVAVSQARGKTSLHALAAEGAAILSGASPERVLAYRRVGEDMALAKQLLNDVRDIYGPLGSSRDLVQRKWTLPRVAFEERATAEQRTRLTSLLGELPQSRDAIGQLFVEAGTIRFLTDVLGSARDRIHETIRHLGHETGPLRLVMNATDAFVAQLKGQPHSSAESRMTSQGGLA